MRRKPGHPIIAVHVLLDVGVPRVASPSLKPNPVALVLLERRAHLVWRIRPVPIKQRIKVNASSAESIPRRLHGFLNKPLRAVTKRLEVREDVNVREMGRTKPAHR